jgi:hypothetical protein
MDVVEPLVERPIVDGVVDVEGAVHGHVVRLYRAQVCSYDLYVRMLMMGVRREGPSFWVWQ